MSLMQDTIFVYHEYPYLFWLLGVLGCILLIGHFEGAA